MLSKNFPNRMVLVLMICALPVTGVQLAAQEFNQPPQLKSVVEGTPPPVHNFNSSSSFSPPQAQNSPSFSGQKPSANAKSDWMFRMKDGSLVMGDLSAPITISVKSRHGDFSVSSDELVSLRMIAKPTKATEADDATREVVVATKSGDIVSGTCGLEPIDIKLSWGQASVDPKSLDFISFRDGSAAPKTISRGTSGGPGWILTPVQIVHREQRIGNATYTVHVQSAGQPLTPPR